MGVISCSENGFIDNEQMTDYTSTNTVHKQGLEMEFETVRETKECEYCGNVN